MPSCSVLRFCQYETTKLVRIQSVRLGSLKWSLNAAILLFICVMMLWNRKYQEFDLVVSSVTTKLKGVAQTGPPAVGQLVWDVVDFSGASQEKNSFFVVTNVIVTRNQKQGRCPEVPSKYRSACRSDQDCQRGFWDLHSHGIQTGSCVKFDVLRKTCEVSAWCPIETKTSPPRPALLAAAENFTVLIKNNIRFPAFNFIRRNILPGMTADYLRSCNRGNDPLCPIFRLGDVVRSAGEKFSEMAVEGGVIGIQIKWDCNLDPLMHHCLPRYSFRRLDEKESNRTLYPGLNFRFARYQQVDGVEGRTLYKAFGIRFDVMVFGQAGKFSFIQLIVYVGSTLSYYALTTILIDWLIGTSCYSAEVGQNYSEKKVEDVQDQQKVILCVSYVDEENLRLVKKPKRKSLQDVKPKSVLPRKEDPGHLRAVLCLLQNQDQNQNQEQKQDQEQNQNQNQDQKQDQEQKQDQAQAQSRSDLRPSWCNCSRCVSSSVLHEQLCCRRRPGGCISSSPLFSQLVLRRPLLEAVLLYRDPLAPPEARVRTSALRRCSYQQFIGWRFGSAPSGCHPAVPSCCIQRIRQEYPSPDGRYRGFRPGRTSMQQAGADGEL